MNRPITFGHKFYGHGKLLLSGEYFILDGALGLAFPTTVGQRMDVRYRKNYNPTIHWKSYTHEKKLWFECNFEFWRFEILTTNNQQIAEKLQTILIQARNQNSHFLRDMENDDIFVDTFLEFPRDWGLGTSSTLIHMIAQWANIGPHQLLINSFLGSGYDIICAQSPGPILYQLENARPTWKITTFNPPFADELFFIHLNKKKDTQLAIMNYKKMPKPTKTSIEKINSITEQLLKTQKMEEFSSLICEHENIISDHLKIKRIKEELFPDYPYEIKSLGAWGGDFILAIGNNNPNFTREYFAKKGHGTCIPFKELVKI